MSVSLQDLQPKNFKIKVKEHEIECKPLRLSHALIVSKIGDIFQNPKNYDSKQIKSAEADLDQVITDLAPELVGISLGINDTISVISQMIDTIEPSDNKELKEKGVKFDADPKGKKTG